MTSPDPTDDPARRTVSACGGVTSRGAPPRGPGAPLWIAVLAAALVAGCVAANVSADIPFDSDEANHANIALRQYQDLRDGEWMDFVRHSYRTGQFPFLHGWMVLPSFAIFGTTLFAARVAQCIHLVIAAAAAGWAAWRISGDDRRAGAIAGGLVAASPLLASLAGLCMLEAPGAAMTAVSLACFAEACRSEGRRATVLHLATAAASLATYFVKLNYGIWIVPAIGAAHAVRLLRGPDRRTALRHGLLYAGAIAVVIAVWYSTEGQRAAFRGFLHNPSQAVSIERDDPTFQVPGFHWENFFAYFGLVARDFHVHWTVGALVLAAAAWAARRTFVAPALAAAVVCVAWTWFVLSMGFREYAMARFVTSALPALWIVAAVGAADVLRRLPQVRALPVVGGVALAACTVVQFVRLPALVRAEYEVDARFAPVFDFVTRSVPSKASMLVVGYTDHTSARTIEWAVGSAPGAEWRLFNVVALNSERIFESDAKLHAWMKSERPWGDDAWRSYVVQFETGPRYLDAAVVIPETAAMWNRAIASYGARLERTATQRFEDLDVTVTVWRDTAPPRHVGLRGAK